MSVIARGTGRRSFTYEWKKVGSDSLPDNASGGNSTELTITSVTSSDSGFYYCIVMSKQEDTVTSDNATINVLCELRLSKCSTFTPKIKGKIVLLMLCCTVNYSGVHTSDVLTPDSFFYLLYT